MSKKLFIIIILLLGITLLSAVLMTQSSKTETASKPIQVNPAGQSPAFNDPVFIVIPTLAVSVTPTATKSATGAILVAPPASDVEAYRQLFALLAHATVTTPTYTIDPIPIERKIAITVKAPFDTNFPAAQKWLDTNGYGDIPPKNFRYIERD